MRIFYDKHSLQDGLQFDDSFMQAMANALVVTPLITPYALKRMLQTGSVEKLDHVLLEWWLALTLHAQPGFPVVRVLPIFCGSVSGMARVDALPMIANVTDHGVGEGRALGWQSLC